MRMGSVVSLSACAVPAILRMRSAGRFSHAQHCQFVRTSSANDSEECRQFMRMRTTVRIHVTKMIYALLFQVVLYHASSERQLLASPLHQNRFQLFFLSVVRNSVADPGCLSRISDLNTVFPSHIQSQKDPGYRSASKNLSNFNPKNGL
jgi:hypothetical protein